MLYFSYNSCICRWSDSSFAARLSIYSLSSIFWKLSSITIFWMSWIVLWSSYISTWYLLLRTPYFCIYLSSSYFYNSSKSKSNSIYTGISQTLSILSTLPLNYFSEFDSNLCCSFIFILLRPLNWSKSKGSRLLVLAYGASKTTSSSYFFEFIFIGSKNFYL